MSLTFDSGSGTHAPELECKNQVLYLVKMVLIIIILLYQVVLEGQLYLMVVFQVLVIPYKQNIFIQYPNLVL